MKLSKTCNKHLPNSVIHEQKSHKQYFFPMAKIVLLSLFLPGTAAGDSGPVREGVTLAGEPTGDGEGPRIPGRWGEVCGEKGDWAGLLCSPWLLDTPEVLTPGLRAPSVPVGRSSMDPERSWSKRRNTGWWWVVQGKLSKSNLLIHSGCLSVDCKGWTGSSANHTNFFYFCRQIHITANDFLFLIVCVS